MSSPFADFGPPAPTAPQQKKPDPFAIELWVCWTLMLVIGAAVWIAGRPNGQWPRTVGVIAPLALFTAAGLAQAYRRSNARFALCFGLAGLLVFISWWYVPTTEGLTYAEASQRLADVSKATGDRDEFWRSYDAAQAGLVSFPEFKATFDRSKSQWANSLVDAGLRELDRMVQEQPAATWGRLKLLEEDLRRLVESPEALRHERLHNARQRLQRAHLTHAVQEVKKLAEKQDRAAIEALTREMQALRNQGFRGTDDDWRAFWEIAGPASIAPEVERARALLKEGKLPEARALVTDLARKTRDHPARDATTRELQLVANEAWKGQYLGFEKRFQEVRQTGRSADLEKLLGEMVAAWGPGDLYIDFATLQSRSAGRSDDSLTGPPRQTWPEWRDLMVACGGEVVKLEIRTAQELLARKDYLAACAHLQSRAQDWLPGQVVWGARVQLAQEHAQVVRARLEAARADFLKLTQADKLDELGNLLQDLEKNWAQGNPVESEVRALVQSGRFWLQVARDAGKAKTP